MTNDTDDMSCPECGRENVLSNRGHVFCLRCGWDDD